MASKSDSIPIEQDATQWIVASVRLLAISLVFACSGCAAGPYWARGRVAPISIVHPRGAVNCDPTCDQPCVDDEVMYCGTIPLPNFSRLVAPVRNAKNRTEAWAWDCRDRCSAWKQKQSDRCDRVKAWFYAKHEEANAPPWPKFHPIPTGPAFERQDDTAAGMPDVYGTFGKANYSGL